MEKNKIIAVSAGQYEHKKEFAPIKNKTGVDSVDSARELLKRNGVEL